MHVALLGARGFGKHHLEAFELSPHVEAVTLAGRDRAALEALRQQFPKVRAIVGDWRKAVTSESVDAVDVALPHDLHLPAAMAALDAGKHVILEKPPARTPEEFRRILDAAEQAGRRVLVVQNLLFSPFHHAVRKAVDGGRIGQPFLSLEVSLATGQRVYEDGANWRADRERCGGGLQIDGGFHAIYRQLFFLESLGAPRRVTADCDQIGVRAPAKGEDFSALTLAYDGGARIHLMSAWTARAGLGRFPSGIIGTEGTLVFTGHDTMPLVLRSLDGSEEPLPVPPGPNGFGPTATANLLHFLECLTTGAEPAVGTDLAMLTLEIITTAYRAAEEGRRLPISGSFVTRFPGLDS